MVKTRQKVGWLDRGNSVIRYIEHLSTHFNVVASSRRLHLRCNLKSSAIGLCCLSSVDCDTSVCDNMVEAKIAKFSVKSS